MRALLPVLVLLIVASAHTTHGQKKRSIPDFANIQYAGSIGFLSAGAGYVVFKNKARASVHYGYVPKVKGGELNILSARLLFGNYTFRLSDKVRFTPLSAGMMVSYHFGKEFRSHWPEHRYPEGYYWWRSSLRFHINTQSSITHELDVMGLKSITYFLDLNINELYLVSYLQNHKSLGLSDVVKMGYGIRVNF